MPSRPRLLDDETLLPAPVQRRSKDKRERLKRAALELFGERGYERTTLEEIAGRAEVAVGGVYLHFRTKRQLLLVLMDDLLERLEHLDVTPRAAGDARRAIHDMLAAAFSADLHYLGAYRAWSEAVRADAALDSVDERIRAWTTGRTRAVFVGLQRLPRARRGVDAAALARTMDVFFWNQLARAAALSRKETREIVDSATHLIYHALFLDSPPRRKSTSR